MTYLCFQAYFEEQRSEEERIAFYPETLTIINKLQG